MGRTYFLGSREMRQDPGILLGDSSVSDDRCVLLGLLTLSKDQLASLLDGEYKLGCQHSWSYGKVSKSHSSECGLLLNPISVQL